MDTQNEFVPLS